MKWIDRTGKSGALSRGRGNKRVSALVFVGARNSHLLNIYFRFRLFKCDLWNNPVRSILFILDFT